MAETTARGRGARGHKPTTPGTATTTHEDANYRETMIRAIEALNAARDHRLGFWTPTQIADHLRLARSTVAMRLARMRAEGSLAVEEVVNAGAVEGTKGYRYGLLGTPPTDAAEGEARAATADAADASLARAREAAAVSRPARGARAGGATARRRNRVAEGRVPVTTTADARLWRKAQQRVLGRGTPKSRVLDAVLEAFLHGGNGAQERQGETRTPHDRLRAYMPTASQPLHEAEAATA